MNVFNTRELAFRYTLTGFISSLLFLFICWLTGLFLHDLPFTAGGVSRLHTLQPVYWLLDSLPIWGTFLSYLFGYRASTIIDRLYRSLKRETDKSAKVLDFIRNLARGKVNAGYQLDDDDDTLGKTLISLRDNLNANQEQDNKRRKEDDQRNWTAEGLALFGDILRKYSSNVEELSFQIIKNLVKYISANQGGFFILQDDATGKPYFNQTACYAYDRKKFAEKQLPWGEGLIGTCAMERGTLYLTNLPDSYLEITSGLGHANPKCLLLVPMIHNEEIHGVFELASFQLLDKYQIEFVEKIAESTASTLSAVKINLRTSRLLKESQEQAEILALQEEQMRQNMEELQATQEEAARQSEKFVNFANSVNHTLIRAEFYPDGVLGYANNKFYNKLGYTGYHEVDGKPISMFINPKDKTWFEGIWDKLINERSHFEGDMKLVTKQGRDLWTMATFTCMTKDERVERVLFLALDTTDQKKQSLDYEGQIDALNRSSLKAEYTPEGDLLEANERFIAIMGLEQSESSSKSVFDFIPREDLNNFRDIWENVTSGNPFQGQHAALTTNQEKRWFRGTYSAVNDMYGEVNKVIYIANDITKEKLMEIETQKQTEQLKRQEEQLRLSGEELSRKLEKAKAEMHQQFQEIEKVKIRNERTLEGALDAIVTINQHGTIEFFNKAAEDLWGYPRKDILGKHIKMLFSEESIANDDFVAKYVSPGSDKLIGQRKEVMIKNGSGYESPVLILLSEAKVDEEHTYTAFIQNIEVELF